MDIIVDNTRDKLTLEWLKTHFPNETIAAAVKQLRGKRKPYVSNICKALGVTPPEMVKYTPKEEAIVQLAAIKGLLTQNFSR